MNFDLALNPTSIIITSVVTFYWAQGLALLYLTHMEVRTCDLNRFLKNIFLSLNCHLLPFCFNRDISSSSVNILKQSMSGIITQKKNLMRINKHRKMRLLTIFIVHFMMLVSWW